MTPEYVVDAQYCVPWHVVKGVSMAVAQHRKVKGQFVCLSCGWNVKNSFKCQWSFMQHLSGMLGQGTHPGTAAWQTWGYDPSNCMPAEEPVAYNVRASELMNVHHGGMPMLEWRPL